MDMIQPVNGHLLIEPLKHESFMAHDSDSYEEIGTVLAADRELTGEPGTAVSSAKISVGDSVYFDSWLAAKFPSEVDGEHYWLVKWEDVRAVDYVKPVSE